MNIDIKYNKKYEKCNLSEDPTIFYGCYDKYEASYDLLKRLARDLGFSYDLYRTLYNISREAADSLVTSMSKQSNLKEIFLLLDEENAQVVDYSLDSSRAPILNSDFISRVSSLAETSSDISMTEVHYLPSDKISSVIIKRVAPIVVEENYITGSVVPHEYNIGILLVNDEANSAYTRLVLYLDDQPVYLPSSYYNSTTTRFKRSTNNSSESLEVLVLKIIDDLRGEDLLEKIKEFHYRYRANKDIAATYEEYNTLLRTMRKIPTVIEDNSVLEDLIHKNENFERHYSTLDDKKSSYIWRCTAIGDITIGALVSITSNILKEIAAPPIEYFPVRELLGTYVSTNRIVQEIAKEDIKD